MAKYADNWGGLTPENKKFIDDMYERFVPWSGKANTVGGEIVRAISRICYKYYNDGDTVARYYSSEYNYSWACDSFIEQYVVGYKSMKNTPEHKFEDELCKNFNHIAEWLKENEQLFQTNNETDCLDNAPYQKWEEDWYEDDWTDEEEI